MEEEEEEGAGEAQQGEGAAAKRAERATAPVSPVAGREAEGAAGEAAAAKRSALHANFGQVWVLLPLSCLALPQNVALPAGLAAYQKWGSMQPGRPAPPHPHGARLWI